MGKVSGIYVILNTKNGKVYIGQTQDFRKRWKEHQSSLIGNYHSNLYLQAAWNKYGSKSFKFQKLEYCDVIQLDEREQHYLDIHMKRGMCYNIAKDVRSPMRDISPSSETRNKMSLAGKGRRHTLESRQRMSDVQKGRVVSEETCRKISESGKKNTNRRGKPTSPEARLKMSASHKGKKLSEETRSKMSKSRTGKKMPPMSEEHRRNLSESHKGQIPSEETRQKLREAAIRHYEQRLIDLEKTSNK